MSLRSPAAAIAVGATILVAAFAAVLLVPMGLGAGFLRSLPFSLCAGLLALGAALLFTRRTAAGGPALAFAACGATGLLFGIVLTSKWLAPESGAVLFAGLLPVSDGSNYFAGALSFLHTGELSSWATRRPLSPLQLAALLGLGGESLRFAVAGLTLIGAAAVVMYIVFVASKIGVWSGAVVAAVLVPFYLPSIGTVMSEHLGLTLGLCGFVVMWRALEDDNGGILFAAGLGIMTLALMARAGAMFVLPLLIIYAGWRWRGTQRFSLRAALYALAAAGSGFAAAAAPAAIFGAQGGQVLSNFAFTLYGLVSGGYDWNRVYRDFPMLHSLSELDQAREAYRLALAHLAAHPFDTLRGILRRYNDFVFNARWFRLDGIGATRYLLAALGLLGLVHVMQHRRENTEGFILAGALGTFLSVPFVADGGVRVHAATFAFSALLLAFGVHWCASRFGRLPAREYTARNFPAAPAGIAAIACATLIAAPFYAGSQKVLNRSACPPGSNGEVLATAADSFVVVQDVRTREAIATNKGRGVSLPDGFNALVPPARIDAAVSLTSPVKLPFLLLAPASGPKLPRLFRACLVQDGAFSRPVTLSPMD